MSRLAAVVLLLIAAAGAAPAQAVIDPGMSKADVIGKLGKPAMEKTTGSSTYLYYRNGMEKTVGMSDIVIVEDGKVVDAVFRSTKRRYSGTSSSPAAIPAAVARKHPPIAGASTAGTLTTKAGSPASAKSAQKPPTEAPSEVAKPIPAAKSAIRDADKVTPPMPDPKAAPATKKP